MLKICRGAGAWIGQSSKPLVVVGAEVFSRGMRKRGMAARSQRPAAASPVG
jgi:hypothetical protein